MSKVCAYAGFIMRRRDFELEYGLTSNQTHDIGDGVFDGSNDPINSV